MKINHQNKASLLALISLRAAILFAAIAFLSANSFGQCHTTVLNISTGVDPNTGAALTNGSTDPAWKVIARSADLNLAVPGLPAPPTAAVVTTFWGNNPAAPPTPSNPSMNSRWVTFYNHTASWYNTTTAPFWFTLEREFEVCETTSIAVMDLDFGRDNYITNFRIVAKPSNALIYTITGNDPAGNPSSYYTNWTTIPGVSMAYSFTPGKYAVQVTVHNYAAGTSNPHGFHLRGSLQSYTANAFLKHGYPNCDCEIVSPDCNDNCYWRLEGNNINMGANGLKNIFGTLTDNDVRIQTNGNTLPGTFRGIIKGGTATTGGYFGWNTMSPTARWHVNCANGNNEGGFSDIRFENLESGTGNILTIDANGYVFNSGVGLSGNFWGLNGNSATPLNYLGTTNNEALRFKTWGTQRAVITAGSGTTSGFMGINTLSPTARLHVNCNSGNEGFISDIRFEGLEPGTGNQLAIDNNGYVFNSGIPVGGGSASTAWNVTGNNITGGNNLLGTITNDDVMLITDFGAGGGPKGIFTAGTGGHGPNDDGRFGWQTVNPTAHLHINCRNGNPDGGPESDVRFEELERGEGKILVINDLGYVFNSGMKVNADGTIEMKMSNNDQETITELKAEVATLRAKLDELANCCTATKTDVIKPEADGSVLYQNSPNPFGKETSIGYYVSKMQQNAYIMIHDLNGRELFTYNIAETGKGSVTVSGERLTPGIYMYSLVVDGNVIDSKRMAFIK